MLVLSAMETFAITVWNKELSPLYDAACCLMLLKDGEKPLHIDVKEFSLYEKADLCRRRGVDTLICGAISNSAFAILSDNGIRVISWIRGPVDEIIETYKGGGDLVVRYGIPGCCRGMAGGGYGERREKKSLKNRKRRDCQNTRRRKKKKEES